MSQREEKRKWGEDLNAVEELKRNYRILDTTSHINNLVFPQKRFTIANCGFQTVAFLCAALACSHAVVLSGYNGDHGLSYGDYSDLDGYIGSAAYKVLPTVAIPVHAVSAAPLHVDADQELYGYKHQADQDNHYDYYVSISFMSSFASSIFFRKLIFSAASIY